MFLFFFFFFYHRRCFFSFKSKDLFSLKEQKPGNICLGYKSPPITIWVEMLKLSVFSGRWEGRYRKEEFQKKKKKVHLYTLQECGHVLGLYMLFFIAKLSLVQICNKLQWKQSLSGPFQYFWLSVTFSIDSECIKDQ